MSIPEGGRILILVLSFGKCTWQLGLVICVRLRLSLSSKLQWVHWYAHFRLWMQCLGDATIGWLRLRTKYASDNWSRFDKCSQGILIALASLPEASGSEIRLWKTKKQCQGCKITVTESCTHVTTWTLLALWKFAHTSSASFKNASDCLKLNEGTGVAHYYLLDNTRNEWDCSFRLVSSSEGRAHCCVACQRIIRYIFRLYNER